MTEQDRAALRAQIWALPPMTDEQIDAVCDLIILARERWARRAPQGQAPRERRDAN